MNLANSYLTTEPEICSSSASCQVDDSCSVFSSAILILYLKWSYLRTDRHQNYFSPTKREIERIKQ